MAEKLFYYNQNDYDNLSYNKPDGSSATIASGGCGVVSACIAINTLAQKTVFTVRQMRDFAKACGARVYDGTDESTLLTAFCKKHTAFSYKTSNNVNELVKHLKSGGVAICNQGDAFNVFSTAGHFVCAWRMVGSNIDVADPSMYSGKYDKSPRPNRIVKKTATGCVVTPSMMAKATQDRNPAYYLISYKKPDEKKYFVPDATVKTACKVYSDNKLTSAVGSVTKGERVKVRMKGKVLAIIQYNITGGYKVGLIKLANLKTDR